MLGTYLKYVTELKNQERTQVNYYLKKQKMHSGHINGKC